LNALALGLLYIDVSQPTPRTTMRRPAAIQNLPAIRNASMTTLFTQLLNDENGFLMSAELILLASILVLGLVVGLTEVSFAINNELEDVASAFSSMNQSYSASGSHSQGKGRRSGSRFNDEQDNCDSQWDIQGSGWQGEY
jgi:Flp pilus assembly pilin Flp